MIIKLALLAALLSEPTVDPNSLDMLYKPCAKMYVDYVEVMQTDRFKGKIMGENLKYLCTPLKQPIGNGEM